VEFFRIYLGRSGLHLFPCTINCQSRDNPDEFLNNDLKQELENEPMPESTPELRDTIVQILDRIAGMSDRIRGYFKQAKADFALN
jgi:hypothetical protein